MWNQKPSFRFEIDHFSEKKALISSKTFMSRGCEWYLTIYPKGDRLADGHLSLYLNVANPTTLGTGWKRSIGFYFVLLNQSDKELHRTSVASTNYCPKAPGWGLRKAMPLSKFQEKGFLENDKLFIEVYIKVTEAFDGEGRDVSENKKKKIVDINGFQVFASQVTKVGNIFAEHPDIALDFKPTNQEVKTAYMNVLLRVIKTLNKPPKSLSETRLNKASSELSELMNVGFKLDWLKSKLEEVSLERKKLDVDGSMVQQLEERVKNLELMEVGLKLDSLNTKLDEAFMERKKADETNESRALKVEKHVKNLGLMDWDLSMRLDSFNAKLDEAVLKRKKADETNESLAQQVEKHVENLGLMNWDLSMRLDSLNTKLDEGFLKRKKVDETNESRAQQVEKDVKNLGLMDLDLSMRLDSLNTKLDEAFLERKKADDTSAKEVEKHAKNLALMDKRMTRLLADFVDTRIILIEEHVMGLGLKLDSLNTKLEEISEEKKKAYDADGSLVQQLEESVENIELMVSHLKVEVDKKKDKTSDDGFLLVD